jgi:hypothetical protein
MHASEASATYEALDPYFWDDCGRFAAKAPRFPAYVMLDEYRKAGNDSARRMDGLKIVEELMLATEDLYIVFTAFRDRH